MNEAGQATYAGRDRRSRFRYNFMEPIAATFGLASLSLTVFSERGAQAEHKDRLAVGREAVLVVSLPSGSESLSARVVWSRYGKSRSSNNLVYVTGFTIIQDAQGVAAEIVDRMVETRHLQFDADTLKRREESDRRKRVQQVVVTEKRAQASDFESENFRIVQAARTFLRNNPQESTKWIGRGRHSTARHSQDMQTEEVYALFEFLGRKVDIRTVKLVCQLS